MLIKEIKEGRRKARHDSPTSTPPLRCLPLCGSAAAGVWDRACVGAGFLSGSLGLRVGGKRSAKPPVPTGAGGGDGTPGTGGCLCPALPRTWLPRFLGTRFLGHGALFRRRRRREGARWRKA